MAALVALTVLALGSTVAADPPEDQAPDEEPEAESPFSEMEAMAGCDSGAGGEVTAQTADSAAGVDFAVIEPEATTFRPSLGRQCHTYHGRRMCEGPRRVPEPNGRAWERAQTLGLTDPHQVARLARSGTPRDEWLHAARALPEEFDLAWPVDEGRLWRGFGRHREVSRVRGRRRRRRHMHYGLDIGAPEGSPIRAVASGLVLFSDNTMSGYGNALLILHRSGHVSLYGHCSATYAFAGQYVRRGQVIAAVGHTGLAHGDHLHFEWRLHGRAIDPIDLFDRAD